MSTYNDKPWEKALSTQEIVDNASNWSLACDSGLLKHLEAFSENLLSQANETNNSLNSLVDNLNAVSIKLDIAKNDFLSLHNTQFIESRVYEDDELLKTDIKEEEEPKKQTEEEVCNDIKDAVLSGLKIIDKYYDKVSVPASDSEDETDFASYVLRPKDPYINRPLPYVIGSEEWHKKWHVGLEGSSDEDSEEEKTSEKFSDTDSESNLPITDRRGISNSNSGTDISNNERPIANSTLNDTLGSSDSEDMDNSLPVKTPISNANFAEQLAAKLGNVIGQNIGVEESDINKRPIQKETKKIMGDLFTDSPPPLDDLDDGFFVPKSKGMFSGTGGLFDDSDEESDPLWKPPIIQNNDKAKIITEANKPKIPNLFDDDNDIFAPNVSKKELPQAVEGGLFDDENDSDDDIFASISKKNTKKSILKPFSNVPTFVDDQPPELDIPQKKKPIGGVSIFGDSDIFSKPKLGSLLPTRRQSSSDSSSETSDRENSKNVGEPKKSGVLFDEKNDTNPKNDYLTKNIKDNTFGKVSLFGDDAGKINVAKKPEVTTNKSKPVSLFDDTDIFEDNLFSNIGNKKFTSNLFDDVAEPSFKERPKTLNFFEDDDDLFAEKPKIMDKNQDNIGKKPATKISTKANLFGSSEDIFRPDKKEETPKLFGEANNLFSSPENYKLFGGTLENSDLFGGEAALFEDTNKRNSLGGSKEINLFEESSSDEDIFAPKTSKNKKVKKIGLDKKKVQLEEESLSPEISKEIMAAFKAIDEGKALPDKKIGVEKQKDDLFGSGKSTKIHDVEGNNLVSGAKSGGVIEERRNSGKKVEAEIVKSKPEIKTKPTKDGKSYSGDKPQPQKRFSKEKASDTGAEIKSNSKKDVDENVRYNPLRSSEEGLDKPIMNFNDVEQKKEAIIDPKEPMINSEDIRNENKLEDKIRRMKSADETHLEKSDEDLFMTKNAPKIPTSKSIPNINLFDSIPPPVDDNWDTRSEINLFDDEDLLFDNIPPSAGLKKSSLFDDEPPEIEPLVVKKVAMKTSLFDDDHKFDDFFDNYPSKSAPRGPALFDDLPPPTDNTGASSISTAIKTDKNIDLVNALKDNDFIVNETKIIKPEVGHKPPVMERPVVGKIDEKISDKSQNINEKSQKIDDGVQKMEEVSYKQKIEETSSTTKNVPGKLKHNLNINVAALMPGNTLPKKRDPGLIKSHSLDYQKPDTIETGNSTEVSGSCKDISNTDVNFNEDYSQVETLHSVVKSRAKIPIKRRPSTRRARQESIQKSILTNSLDNDEAANNNHENDSDYGTGSFEANENIEEKASSRTRQAEAAPVENLRPTTSLKTEDAEKPEESKNITIDNDEIKSKSSSRNAKNKKQSIESTQTRTKTVEHSFSAEIENAGKPDLVDKNVPRPGILKKTSNDHQNIAKDFKTIKNQSINTDQEDENNMNVSKSDDIKSSKDDQIKSSDSSYKVDQIKNSNSSYKDDQIKSSNSSYKDDQLKNIGSSYKDDQIKGDQVKISNSSSHDNENKINKSILQGDEKLITKNNKGTAADDPKSATTKNITNIFEDDDSDSDIFASLKNAKKVSNKNAAAQKPIIPKTVNLFGENNNDQIQEDLFESAPNLRKTDGNQTRKAAKGVLFRDDQIKSEDDDIFERVSASSVKQSAQIPAQTKVTATDQLFGKGSKTGIFNNAEDLFSSQKINVKKDVAKKSIFDDDDGDDLFSSKKLPARSKLVKQGSLFEDVDDSDDIFASSSQKNVKIAKNISIIKNNERIQDRNKHLLRKSEDKEVLDDPLRM